MHSSRRSHKEIFAASRRTWEAQLLAQNTHTHTKKHTQSTRKRENTAQALTCTHTLPSSRREWSRMSLITTDNCSPHACAIFAAAISRRGSGRNFFEGLYEQPNMSITGNDSYVCEPTLVTYQLRAAPV